jgi:endonuclease/exonuclease/phosphatase family metal-dependent hydrolase
LPDRNGNRVTSKALDILKDIDRSQGGAEPVSIAGIIPKSQRYSSWYDIDRDAKVDSTELSMLDYILISRKLSKQVKKAGIFSKGYDPAKASDHYPVWVRLSLQGF